MSRRGLQLYLATLLLMVGAVATVAGPTLAGIDMAQAHGPAWAILAWLVGGLAALACSGLLFLAAGPAQLAPARIVVDATRLGNQRPGGADE